MSFNSCMIRAKKYAVYIPTLSKMEHDLDGSIESICKRIKVFWKDDEKLTEELINWVRYLYDSGQTVEDWNINFLSLSDFDEYNGTLPENMTVEEKKEILTQIALKKFSKQLEELERYTQTFGVI